MQISMIDRTVAMNSILGVDLIDWGHLPIAIRDRLQSLRDISADRHGTVARLMDEIADTRLERQRAEGRLRELGRRHDLADDHPSVQEVTNVIARSSATIERLELRLNESSASWQGAARLSENLELYVRKNCAGEIRMFKGAAPQLLKNEASAAALERAARRGRSLLADRQEVQASPFPSTVAKKLAREQIARRAENACPDVHGLVNRLDVIQFRLDGLAREQIDAHDVYKVDAVGLMAWLFQKISLPRSTVRSTLRATTKSR